MKLISFAYDFVSYLLEKIETKNIDKIILFGSVVRGEADKESDIDIFLETKYDIQNEINKTIDKFYESAKYTKYWKLLNVKNQIKVIVGKLENYPELKRSIIGNSLVLFSNFKEKISGENYSLFILEFKGAFKDKVRLWRRLYGHKQQVKKKHYHSKGIVDENNGKKIARGVFIIPIQNSNNVIKELKKLGVRYKILDITTDKL